MIEQSILKHLGGAGIEAHTEIPDGGGSPPFCVVERTGGSISEHIRRATVAVQSYGASLYEAASLNDRAVRAMELLPERPEIAACRLNSDYNFTDMDKKQYRYQAVFDIVYYETEE